MSNMKNKMTEGISKTAHQVGDAMSNIVGDVKEEMTKEKVKASVVGTVEGLKGAFNELKDGVQDKYHHMRHK
jgi:hypothetical protein